MQRTQKRAHVRTQKRSVTRLSDEALFRQAESFAKKLTGLADGPWSANSVHDERRFSVAYRLGRAMSPGFRNRVLKELR